MSNFNKTREQLQQTRAQKEQMRLALFIEKEKLKKIETEQVSLDRVFDAKNKQHRARQAQLKKSRLQAEAQIKQLQESYRGQIVLESRTYQEFSRLSDPIKRVTDLSDDYPFLLFPVRVETRFKTVTSASGANQPQLWVRVYPDDCLVDTFEPFLSEKEVKNAQSYWAEVWRAGSFEDGERGAWRTLVGSHGSGRSAWIVEHYQPLNLEDKPQKAEEHDIILVIATDTPLAGPEKSAADTFWRAVWLADGDMEQERNALNGLKAAVGEGRATTIVENYRPINLDEQPAPPFGRTDISLTVATVIFPKPDDVDTKQLSWTQVAKANIMPDRFVVMGYSDGKPAFDPVIGNPIPSPLIVSPDPSAAAEDQMRPAGDEIVVADEMKWMVDFDRAIEVGMGFKIDLTTEQANTGFDRLLVLGLKLSSDENESKALLEKLIHNHQFGRKGFSILPQGTPTNNTEKAGSGFTSTDDADVSFDIFIKKKDGLFEETSDWLTRRDGQWLAESLGIDSEVLKKVSHSDSTDQCEAKAMNIALWPATMGYFLETMMDPIIEDRMVDQTRWFFNNFVSGRGMVPAICIGHQPYGILPTTAFSRLNWMFNIDFRTPGDIPHPPGYREFLRKLHPLLSRIAADWSDLADQVSYVGKPGDAHQILLDIIGLHANSVEFHQRFAEGFKHLYNWLNIIGATTEDVTNAYIESGMQLLKKLGYDGEDVPEVLTKLFLNSQNPLNGNNGQKPPPLIDDRPLSELEGIRIYTTDSKNYIEWLIDAARTSLETVRLEKGFIDNKSPNALLYLLLRHAIQLGYWDASLRFYHIAELLHGDAMKAARREPDFIHVRGEVKQSESRWYYLYQAEPRITQSENLLVSEYIPLVVEQAFAARDLNGQLKALEHLKGIPTARLERIFAEHIGCCTYRLDAWESGLISYQLAAMRSHELGKPKGIYLGAFGWLEDVRPSEKVLTPVELEPDLEPIFSKPGDPKLVQDSTNAGYIHTPSLNHAVTAAVLRNGYISHKGSTDSNILAVNLSSERVRQALAILEGIRNGQSLAALLGYQLERGLHDRHDVEVDRFIFKLRKAFPLYSDRFNTTRTEQDIPIENIEARNVINGLDLINHIKNTGQRTYPYGKPNLPSADQNQANAINEEVNRIMNLHDAVADLAMAESVHQVVQGNYDRAAATLDAYSKASFPPEPEVIKTPRSGITLTHRVALHLEAELDPDLSMTPRAKAEPAINNWLSSILPAPDRIGCKVTYLDAGNETKEEFVTQQNLQLQPLDLLYIIKPEAEQAMTELDDRVVHYVINNLSPKPDSEITIKYIDRVTDRYTFFELAPLIKSLRALILRSRPLKAGDIALQNEATSSIEKNVFLNNQRINSIIIPLQGLKGDLLNFHSDLELLLNDKEANKAQIIDNVDTNIDHFVNLLSPVGLYGIPQTGFGFAFDWKRQQLRAINGKISDLVNRWQGKVDQFDALMREYDELPLTASDEEKFALLQKAERLVSTIPTVVMPDDLDKFKEDVLIAIERKQFVEKKGEFAALLSTPTASIAPLLSGVKAILPISDFDLIGIDVADVEKQIVLFVEDLFAHAKNLTDDLEKRLNGANEQIEIFNNAASSTVRVKALLQAGKILLGEDFRIVPEFGITPKQGDEWKNAWDSEHQLLDYQRNIVNTAFPVDDWLYGVGRVREKMRHWENVVMLARAFTRSELELHPMQLPYKLNEYWLALSFPENYKFEGETLLPGDYKIDGDRLLYTAHYAVPVSKEKRQCGLLIDEWTEIIPAKNEITGITFHYDRPNSEPPQTMLLVTPPDYKGNWQWQDLVDALHETLEMAKQRAVEPQQIDGTPYARFLPAILMAVTRYPITIGVNLAAINRVEDFYPG